MKILRMGFGHLPPRPSLLMSDRDDRPPPTFQQRVAPLSPTETVTRHKGKLQLRRNNSASTVTLFFNLKHLSLIEYKIQHCHPRFLLRYRFTPMIWRSRKLTHADFWNVCHSRYADTISYFTDKHFGVEWNTATGVKNRLWFLPERDYVTFGSLLSPICPSVCL